MVAKTPHLSHQIEGAPIFFASSCSYYLTPEYTSEAKIARYRTLSLAEENTSKWYHYSSVTTKTKEEEIKRYLALSLAESYWIDYDPGPFNCKDTNKDTMSKYNVFHWNKHNNLQEKYKIELETKKAQTKVQRKLTLVLKIKDWWRHRIKYERWWQDRIHLKRQWRPSVNLERQWRHQIPLKRQQRHRIK